MTLIVKVEKPISHERQLAFSDHLLVPALQHDFVVIFYAADEIDAVDVAVSRIFF